MSPRERICEVSEPAATPAEAESARPDEPAESTDIPIVSGLVALPVASVDAESRRVKLKLGKALVEARLDDTVHPIVATTALARGERLVAQQEDGAFVVLGALRTAPTPGIERGDDFVIEARRVSLRGDHEVSVVAGASSVVLRALGHLELLSKNITARAEGVQKLVARMIQLN